MGATANLASEMETINAGMDSVVIRHFVAGILGGRTLDVSNYKLPVIKAGHVVIRDTASDTYKPMPVNSDGTAYESLPGSHEYVGVVVCSKPVSEPLVGIMYAGEVNDMASPFPVDSIKDAMKTALPTLVFMHD
ncbi:hypothetical protein MUN53_14530 [Parabacteroides sp. AGMB00274]|uniref:Head decoration protein n=1 Tax=Parabacteroides faecalis TaxID=2924040 RepID=A0ABT0C470_9BACT|nr:hypothetical protein [Parabacteroides faecalis]MCJ2381806.1 hypothetical protein [Parabacteroides faecalis]